LAKECTLALTTGSQTLSWTLNLIGDGRDYSDENNYIYLPKTYIEPEKAVENKLY